MKDSKNSQSINKTLICDETSADCEKCVDKTYAEKKEKKKARRDKKEGLHIDNTSFLALLLRGFISFSLLIIFAVCMIFAISYLVMDRARIAISSANFSNYADTLVKGNYGEIPVKTVLGDSGWFEIVDSDANLVYSTLNDPNSYTLGELDNIQRFDVAEEITVNTFKMVTNEYTYLITKYSVDENGNRQEQYLLLDAEYKVITGSIPTTKNQFTQREFELLTYNAQSGAGKLNKLSFTGSDGKDYYAVFLDQRTESHASVYVLIAMITTCIAVLYVIVVIQYVRYINKHVQKPLSTLSNAMTDFANGNFREEIVYRGSKEFEQLCDSFNEMVSLLNASDEQRKLLEGDKRRMLAGLSHDLKTPITIIQGFAKAMRDGLVDDADKQKYLQLIVTKSESMSDLINEFYDYTKLEHPDFSLTKESVDMAELARTFLADIYDEFDFKDRRLDAHISEEVVLCNVDKKQMIRVFENLTSNFFKYTPSKSTLYFGVEKKGSFAEIVIADNGVGISLESRGDIFKPFVVGEKSRNKQGSGLGLAVCEKIVTAHGGSIELSDNPIDGFTTQFVIVLPTVDI